MSIRDQLRKPAVGGSLAGGVLVFAVVYAVFFSEPEYTGPKKEVNHHYWDLQEKKLFPGPTDQYPPIKAPSGGEGVRAYVYSCSDCADKESHVVGYLFKNSDEAKALLVAEADMTGGENYQTWYDGQLVRPVDDGDWVNIHSDEGKAIVKEAKGKCGASKPIECRIEE